MVTILKYRVGGRIMDVSARKVIQQPRRRLWIGALVLAILAGGAWARWTTRDHELSEKPQRSASSLALSSKPSSVQATATLEVAAITDAINKAIPTTFRIAGRQKVCAKLTEQIKKTIQKKVGGDVGKFLGEVTKFITDVITVDQIRDVCQDVDYHVDINRDGAVQVTSAGDHLHVSVPISATGQAGFTGDVAKALALDKKNFRGALNAFADISLDIGSDWCPAFTASADFNWTNKAEFEIVHNWWINIDGEVGPKLKEKIQNAIADFKTKVTCDDVKKAVTPFWHSYSFPIAAPGETGPTAFVTLTPIKIGFSGIHYEATALRVALGIDAITDVATTSVVPGAKSSDLPQLERISTTSNRLSITVPIRVGYDDAVATGSKLLKDKTFEADTPVGKVKLHIDEVSIYPSAGKLALGMHFVAEMGNKIPDTSGWVYLVAEPFVDEAGQVVRLKNVTFTRQLDNDLWSVLSAVFSGQIKRLIEEQATYDLKPDIARLRTKVNEQLADLATKQKIIIVIEDGFVGLKQINLAEKALELAVGLEGTANIAVDAINIPSK